ncbi:hypothetical protein TNCV_53451 [Trichonephila clavipes]|nr:hypothetical protein TNCV_53451 [Trichonephila clavipes]
MSKSVSIMIEDEGEPLPPCTMILQNDPLNHSMPRLLEIGSSGVTDSQARIEQNTIETVHMPSTPVSIKDAQVQSSAGPSSSPKNDCGPSPPREQSSPSVLDIILNDVSIQIEPDDVVIEIEPELDELSREWKGRITGSPNKPAFPPPSYDKVAKAGAKQIAAVLKLWSCTKCPAKCYTEKGLRSHSESCPGKGKPLGVREQNSSNSDHVAKVVPKGKKNKTRKGGKIAPVVKPVYCKHCNRKIFLSSTLENHYMRKHFRRLSPQSSPSVNDE